DANTLRRALELGDMVDGKLLNQVLGMVDGDNLKLAGQALTALFGMMDNAGVKMTAEIAGKVLKGVAKAVPVAGAAVAGYDAVRMAQIAADPNVPPDIRYMAAQAAKLNTVDAALSVAEPFIAAAYGIPVAVDIAMAVAETALDVIVTDQYEKFQQQGDAYQAPDWLKVANVGMAVAQGAIGTAAVPGAGMVLGPSAAAMELALYYGPEGATELVGAVSRMSGDAAIQAVELQQTLAAQGIGEGMEMTADGLHTLADVIRHPEKYGAMAEQMVGQALDKLGEMAQGAGELADAARRQLTETVDYLKGLGEKGVETLQWIATHPGEAATQAINALSGMVNEAMRMGTEAGRQLAESAMTALGNAQKALAQLGEAGAKALDAVTDAIGNVAESALAAGKQGVETLVWMLNHPGETAQMAEAALTDIMAKGGEMGKHAWDQLMALGDAGLKFAQDVIGKLGEAGAAGLEMLKYAVENPGEAAEQIRQAALNGLEALANGAGEVASAAVDAITGFVDSGIKEAQKTAEHLLTQGGAAAQRIIDTWSRELSEGGKAVIEGLKDLGDAGREALGKLANAGIAFAGEVLGRIGEAVQDAAETVVEGAQDAWNRRDEGIPHIPFI
ncbi:MAG: hypothetical protein Q4D74_06565, partial [Comamonadaceae bacterium]|nr:hypothetical protein [Comamonadaceae bacterium]